MSLPYPAERLLKCAIQSEITPIKNTSRNTGIPRWSRVANMCGVGSNSGREICLHFGMDPDEKMRREG